MSITVECLANQLEHVPESFLYEKAGYRRTTVFPLTVGRRYVVYAVTSFIGGFWFYITDDDGLGYPVWYPSAVFRGIESRVPSDWILGHHFVNNRAYTTILSYPEWASDPHYYERLYNGEQSAVAAFQLRRASAEAET